MTNEPAALGAPLNPSEVLAQVAGALPQQLHSRVVICGSLAAAYHFFSRDGAASLRTKDVDILFSPHALAVDTAVEVTEQLLAANWKQREDAKFGTGGRPEDDIKDLPVVRLRPPPGVSAQAQWFLELLSAPPQYEAGGQEKTNQRVHTRAGDFTIPSFTYLALAEWKPIETHHGVLIARPRDDGAGQHAPPSVHPRRPDARRGRLEAIEQGSGPRARDGPSDARTRSP